MKVTGRNQRSAFTIIEVVIALAGILVVIVGALSFEYYCAVDTREADVRAGANRLALLLLEGWRGSGGRVWPDPYEFNPVVEFAPILGNNNIHDSSVGLPGIGPELGRYKVVANRTNYFVTLSHNTNVDASLRTLSITVAWSRDYKAEELTELVRSICLTTIVKKV